MSALRFPKWQKPCEQALLEPDPEKLFLRVLVAETAIFHCLHDFTSRPGNIELQAIDEMLKNLQRLLANSFTLPEGPEADAQVQAQAPGTTPRRQTRTKPQPQPSA